MKIRKIISYILYVISAASIFLASGIRQVKDWWDIAKPFFAVWFICLVIALTLSNIETIRRYTYPSFICACAWAYKHKLLMTKFTRNTYRLYRWKNNSYNDLFTYVQRLFDIIYE